MTLLFQGSEFNLGEFDDPVTYKEVIISSQSEEWLKSMKYELESMSKNEDWELVQLLKGCKAIFKIKRDSKEDLKGYKVRLVVKGFTQKEGIELTTAKHFFSGIYQRFI